MMNIECNAYRLLCKEKLLNNLCYATITGAGATTGADATGTGAGAAGTATAG